MKMDKNRVSWDRLFVKLMRVHFFFKQLLYNYGQNIFA
jgi:hypothetical protein